MASPSFCFSNRHGCILLGLLVPVSCFRSPKFTKLLKAASPAGIHQHVQGLISRLSPRAVQPQHCFCNGVQERPPFRLNVPRLPQDAGGEFKISINNFSQKQIFTNFVCSFKSLSWYKYNVNAFCNCL